MVKTIGDAVMATFPTPDRAVAAALRMREAMRTAQRAGRARTCCSRSASTRVLPRGHAERPPGLFRPDGNIASRVQSLAVSRSIFATGSVVEHLGADRLLETSDAPSL